MDTKHVVGLSILAVLILGVVAVAICYQRDMGATQARLSADSRWVETACGRIEYGERGDGPPVLVIHGAGGGFDQGLTLGEYLVGDGYHIIAPSRFGYANSPILADSSLEAQVDTYICLLDALDIKEPIYVVGVSAGGPSGLMYAVSHPDRVRGLVMAAALSHSEEVPQDLARQVKGVNMVMGNDFLYWAVNKVMQPKLVTMLGIPAEVQATLSPEARVQVKRIMDEMNPMSTRLPGTLLDQTRWIPPSLAAQVSVPTLVLHCEDDGLVPLSQGQHTQDSIAASSMVTFPTGGHFFAGRMDPAREAARAFLEQH